MPTIMNLLGPLVNPAGVTRQVVGWPMNRGVRCRRAPWPGSAPATRWSLHASVGMDEISPSGAAGLGSGAGTCGGGMSPASHGLECHDLEGLAGGEPRENAALIEQLLEGKGNRRTRCAALLNAGAALYVSGNGWSFEEAVERADSAGQRRCRPGARPAPNGGAGRESLMDLSTSE